MSYDDWLHSRFAPDDCYGCKFNNPVTAHCSYSGRYCFFYVDFNRKCNPPQLNLFENG